MQREKVVWQLDLKGCGAGVGFDEAAKSEEPVRCVKGRGRDFSGALTLFYLRHIRSCFSSTILTPHPPPFFGGDFYFSGS